MKAAPVKIFSKLIKSVKKDPKITKKVSDCICYSVDPKMADSVTKTFVENVKPDVVLSQINKSKIAGLLGISAIGSTTAYAKTKEASRKLGGYASTTA